MRNTKNHSCAGFTLVELSIVIVIIGLIVAGVVGGQTLVKQAKLRTIAADFQKFETALNAFLLSYDQLPGDFDKAQDYWGAGVNNGNDDNFITCEGGAQRHEAIDVWEHLYRAEILSEIYVGASGAGNQDVSVGGVNVPKSSYSNQVYSIFSSNPFIIFNRQIMMSIVFGTQGTSCPWCNGGLLANDARSIDMKVDDGIANQGKLLGVDGNAPAAGSCSQKYTTAGADYNLSSTLEACRLFYIYRGN